MPRPRKEIEGVPPIRKRIAENLRAAREAGGWTVAQCASDVGVAAVTWYTWESADRSVPSDMLDAVAACVCIKTTELVGDVE